MNRMTTAIIAMSLFSAVATAQTAVKVRPAEKIQPGKSAVKVEPSAKSAQTGSVAAQVGASEKAVGSCNPTDIANKLSSGTRASFADADKAIKSGLLTNGACGNGLTEMAPAARENAVEAVASVIRSGKANLKGEALKLALAEGLAEALNNDAGATKTTPEAQLAAVEQLQNNCGIFATR